MGSTAHDYEALHSIYDSTILLRVPFYFFFYAYTHLYQLYECLLYSALSYFSSIRVPIRAYSWRFQK